MSISEKVQMQNNKQKTNYLTNTYYIPCFLSKLIQKCKGGPQTSSHEVTSLEIIYLEITSFKITVLEIYSTEFSSLKIISLELA